MEKYTLNVEELAAALGIAARSIITHRAGMKNMAILQGLPDPVQSRPLLWFKADIEAWIESRRTFRPTPGPSSAPAPASTAEPTKRPRGRPRKMAPVAYRE